MSARIWDEYVCAVKIPAHYTVDVHERVTRCRGCRSFAPSGGEGDEDWCIHFQSHMHGYDFCSHGEPRGEDEQ